MSAGVIVAGGRSSRFGDTDKAIAQLGGKSMIRRIADRLNSCVDELVINCREDQVVAIEAVLEDVISPTFACDETSDLGPLAGIATGLDAVESEYTFVVACDMPFVDPSFVEYLYERAEGCDAAVPRPDEWLQPMHAVYRTETMAIDSKRALDCDVHRVRDTLSDIDCTVVERDEITNRTSMMTFKNLNTREEFLTAEDLIKGCNECYTYR